MPNMLSRLAVGVLLLCLFLASQICGHAAEFTADQALRYINDDVLTFNDVRQRNQMRLAEYRHKGLVEPDNTEAALIAFSQESLEQLTDEALLVSKAKELKLTPDHDRVTLQILSQAKSMGIALTLRQQAEERKREERRQSIDMLMTYFYDNRAPLVTPEVLFAEYQRRQQEFARPARARVLQIVLRAVSDDERAGLKKQRLSIFQRAQASTDATIAPLAATHMQRYMAASAAEQDGVLATAVAELAAFAEHAEVIAALPAPEAKLVADAAAVVKLATSIRDQAAVVADLDALRQQLAGQGEPAFMIAMRLRGIELVIGADGKPGVWIEPDYYSGENQVFATPAGGMAPVFAAKQSVCLVFVQANEPARVQSFAEVSGVLEGGFRRPRLDLIRQEAVGILRQRASIRDLLPLKRVLE